MKTKINRKEFLKVVLYALLIPFAFVIHKMIGDLKRFGNTNSIIKIPNDIPNGLSIQDDFILSKTPKDLKVFSSRCTHLGCKINAIDQNEIVCPCHGSRYNEYGEPTKGPSIKSLQSFSYEIDIENNEVLINTASNEI